MGINVGGMDPTGGSYSGYPGSKYWNVDSALDGRELLILII